MRSFRLLSLCLLFSAACGTTTPTTITSSEVTVETSQMDVTLARKDAFEETFMVFGGMNSDRDDMFTKVTIVGLPMSAARPIAKRYPDFHRCKSGGASLAQQATQQMDIVPANGDVLAQLQETLSAHQDSLGEGADRVCVRMKGSKLEISQAVAQGEDITGQLPPMFMKEYFLVESAEIVDAKAALAGR